MAEKKGVLSANESFFTEEMFGENVFCDVSEEFTLPEYEPEIKKILRVSARVLPAGKYVGGGRAELAGTVVYGIIYCGSEGEIASVSLSSDYEFAVPMLHAEREPAVYADTRADSVVCRPLGPRRLQIRTKLKSKVEMLARASVVGCEAAEDACLLRSVRYASARRRFTGGEFDVSSDIKLRGKPIACDGSVAVTEIRAEKGSVFCRGEVWARVTCVDSGLLTVEKRIPFERRFEADISGTEECRAIPFCWSCECTGDGENGEISAIIEVEAECAASFPVSVTEDAFVCGRECTVERKRAELSYVRSCSLMRLSVSGKRMLTSEEASLGAVCAPWYEVAFEQTPAQSEGVVSGTVTVHCILAGGGAECAPARVEMPFKTTVCDGGAGKLFRSACAEVSGLRVYIEGGSLCAEGELWISAVITEKTQDDAVCSVKAQGAERTEGGSTVTVLYPQKGDTLWSIAKQRRVSPEALCKMNGMDDGACADPNAADSLDGVRCLMIMK
ncbi:MAG: LysM peptidoglycan-binding domain-containing protein [Clostridia bacterium]|nr:LysM peptidoglycan-binding domain-containing protein [Clostridia bacterium]